MNLLLVNSAKGAFLNLTPWIQFRNPILFLCYAGALLSSGYIFNDFLVGKFSWFNFQLVLWMWLTVYIANFAQVFAEGRGRAQAVAIRNLNVNAFARQIRNGLREKIPASSLVEGDTIICEAGDVIPADGEVVEGVATVDESAITGESAPVIREAGGDRNGVTAGTKVLSDWLVIQVTSRIGDSFLDQIVSLMEGEKRKKTSNELALESILNGLTIIIFISLLALKSFADFSNFTVSQGSFKELTLPVFFALFICLIPTMASALLAVVGISGMNRLVRKNIIAKNEHSVEIGANINLLILDKTGTITIGNRIATAFLPAEGIPEKEFAAIAQLASLSDETPEGRSIVVLAKELFNLRADSLDTTNSIFTPFSPKARMSGIDFIDSESKIVRCIRKGAVDTIKKHIEERGGFFPEILQQAVQSIAKKGETPLIVCDGNLIVGIVSLKDTVKGGLREKFEKMRQMGIRTLMVTGDSPLTAAAIAAETGVDDYIAEATPDIKLELIKTEQSKGSLVAMAGDGTNDAPALAQADVALAMHTGTRASRDAGNMVDLDSNPTKLIDIVEISKQLMITRGGLTIFNISNILAKYCAIIPALFGSLYYGANKSESPLSTLNFMKLHSFESAILSTLIFNALVLVAFIPMALHGIKCKAESIDCLLRRNMLLFGLGGLVVPFFGIKIIDLLITYIHIVP